MELGDLDLGAGSDALEVLIQVGPISSTQKAIQGVHSAPVGIRTGIIGIGGKNLRGVEQLRAVDSIGDGGVEGGLEDLGEALRSFCMGGHESCVPLDLIPKGFLGLLQLNPGARLVGSFLGVAEPITNVSAVHVNVPLALGVGEQLIEGKGVDLLDRVDGVLGIVLEEEKRLGMVFEVIIALVIFLVLHFSTKRIHHRGVGRAACSLILVHLLHLGVHVGDGGLLLWGVFGALLGLGLQPGRSLDPEVDDVQLLLVVLRAHLPHELQLIETVVLSELLALVLELVIGRRLDHLLHLLRGFSLLGDS